MSYGVGVGGIARILKLKPNLSSTKHTKLKLDTTSVKACFSYKIESGVDQYPQI